jgi:ribosomal protein S18 acetylase RimI-like enzyme
MTVTLQLMPADRIGTWLDQRFDIYLAERIESGEAPDVAEAKVRRSHDDYFPGGQPLPTHSIFDVLVDGDVVGWLWIGPQLGGTDTWWIFDVEIAEPHRRRGYARAALELGHEEAKRLGATSIGLNVFGFNTGARELYEKLGYAVTATQMKRPL